MPTLSTMATGDPDLVAQLRDQGVRGLAGVYTAYADRLYGYAISVARDGDIAADAVHDALLVAADRIGQLRDPERLRPWLFAITRNECLRHLRRRDRYTSTGESEEVWDTMSDTPDLTTNLSREESAELVHSAMGGLSPSDRDVLVLALAQDLDAGAVAQVLGTDRKGVHARLSRARDSLRVAVMSLFLLRTRGRDCPTLAGIVRDADRLDPLLRKRIARHLKDCDECERRSRAAVLACAPAMAAPIAAVSAPLGLHDRLFGPEGSAGAGADPAEAARLGARAEPFASDGFPVPLDAGLTAPGDPQGRGAGPRRALLIAAAAMLLLLVGAWIVRAGTADQPLAEAPPVTPTGPEVSPSPSAGSVVPTETTIAPADDPAATGDSSPSTTSDQSSSTGNDGGTSPTDDPAGTSPQKVQADSASGDVAAADPATAAVQAPTSPQIASPKPHRTSRPHHRPRHSHRPTPEPTRTPTPKPTRTPTPRPTPSRTSTPTPTPTPPVVITTRLTDLDRAADGSFTRCDAFRLRVTARVSGSVTGVTADYGTGALPLSRSGDHWTGTRQLAPGDYTVQVSATGPGGTRTGPTRTVLHICPG